MKDTEQDKAILKKYMEAVAAAHTDAKSKNLGKGHGGQSEMPCPTGCGGTLRYSVASYNGHMWAKCDTDSCVKWIE